ncbi:hypothetical protein PK35_15310 [Tamlana nanhaiensis]|uniref:PepSY domain-containing protein n=1 Tax=Neotamlana nanhaiensis TaxID=1382798 RepID=A0A0D7VWH5_9FLAO|nr:hypothetical protein [Tamlana nanhaiensis]KJD31206.1 hypothetical protein PK35_15310 [Tamlana nanhaiensis]
MKKLPIIIAFGLLFNVAANADTIKNSKLNLNNPDVRKCLIEAAQSEGWKLASVYLNANNKIVYVFDKENDTKIYTSNQAFSN